MSAFKLPVRGLDGALQAVEVLPSTDIADLRKTLGTRFNLSEFQNVKLLLGSQILSGGTVAEAGLSAAEELQIVKVVAVEEVIQALGDDLVEMVKEEELQREWGGERVELPDRYRVAMKLLEDVTWLSEESSMELFDVLNQVTRYQRGCSEEYKSNVLKIGDIFGRVCHDPHYWSKAIANGYPEGKSDKRFSTCLRARMKSAMDSRKEDPIEADECREGNHSTADEDICGSLHLHTANVHDPPSLCHQAERPASAAVATVVPTVNSADTDYKEDLVRAIEASEAEALQLEQADITMAILENKMLSTPKAGSAPGRMLHDICSSSCSSWRCAARALRDIEVASEATPEQWDDVPNVWELKDPVVAVAEPEDEQDARCESASLLPPATSKPPGTFYPPVASWNGSTLQHRGSYLAPPINAADAVLELHGSGALALGSKGSDKAQASFSMDQPHAEHGSKRTKNHNRRKREREQIQD